VSSAASAATPRFPLAASDATTVLKETPAWADSFADSIGVDASYETHKYPPLVTTMLKSSGIRHLRDSGAASPLLLGIFADLGRSGIDHSIGMPQDFEPAKLKALLIAFAPYVGFVEGANEADNVPKPNWAQMKLDQKNLWNTVRGDKAFDHVAVMGTSFANPLNGTHVAPLDAIEDFAQLHNATCDWNPGTDISWVSIAANTAKIRLSTYEKPIVTTETGYNDNPARGCSLPDDIIAKYTPRTSAERWLAHEPRTYFTFLVDNPSDPVFGAKGLLFVDGRPKPQFLTLSDLIAVTADPGVAPKAKSVSYGMSGLTSDVHHIMLARRDGSYDLMLWRELPAWDHDTRRTIPISQLSVSVHLPSDTSRAELFQYNRSYGLDRTQLPTSRSGDTSTFKISDAISILHLYR
jgi:hypothetical protein